VKGLVALPEREGSRNEQRRSRHVHVAWLCIGEDSRRVEDGDIEVCEMLARYVPVVAVVTKARSDQGFRDEVQRLLPQACARSRRRMTRATRSSRAG
jgi:hypothetical protein